MLPKFDEFIGLCLQGVGGQDAQCVATSVQGFHFLPLLRRSFLFFFFKLMPPIQSFAPVWNNFFFFDLAQSLAQQSVSHVDDIKTSDFFYRLNPNCVFLCVRLTHMKVHGFMTDLCDGWNTVYFTNVFGYVISDAL